MRLLPVILISISLCFTPLFAKKGSSSKKTVHVKGYKKKDGTRVSSHNRKAPRR